jgi:nitroreductase
MNDVVNLLMKRKSVRAFSDREITRREKDTILESAIQAPTAGNQLLYTILDITDQAIKDELAVSCDNQPFIARAPMVLIFLADCRRWMDCYRSAGVRFRDPGVGDLILACEDALIAAQNAVIAAESMGIGSCYIGDILENKERVVELLDLDRFVFPVTMVVFGRPAEGQKTRSKPRRFDKKYIVRENRYSPLDEKTVREMHAEQAADSEYDFDTFMRAFCERKYMSEFAREMTRSVAEYIKNFEK